VKKSAFRPQVQIIAVAIVSIFQFATIQNLKAENLTATFSVFPPLTYPKALKRPSGPGILVEIYQKVLPKLGYKVDLLQLPPKRIVAMMA